MLTVTDNAAKYLRESLTRKEEGAPEAIRIVYTEDGYQLTLDDAKDGDHVFEQEGQNYLVVDSELGEVLSDATLDVQDSQQGPKLTLLASEPPPPPEAEAEPPSEPSSDPKA